MLEVIKQLRLEWFYWVSQEPRIKGPDPNHLLVSHPSLNEIGSSYSVEKGRDRDEREAVRAQASLQALDRGEVGCLMSPVDMVRAMGALLRMHQSELEMQVRFHHTSWTNRQGCLGRRGATN